MDMVRIPAPMASFGRRIGELDPLRRILLGCALALLLAGFLLPNILAQPATITSYFFAFDAMWLLALGCFLVSVALLPAPAFAEAWTCLAWAPRSSIALLATVVAAAALTGTYGIQHGIGLSADEAMAAFDAQIFLGGRLLAPLPPEWRDSVAALAPNFVLPVPGNVAWASSYLPVNAALRAAFGLVATPALAGPVLAAVAVLALAGIARRLWPERPDAMIVAVLMLATSPQVLFTAMTPYAMTAHLALNLVWLWLFLRGGRLGHGGAIAVAFLACGLHQVIFHPLFAAPILLGLVARRRWGLSVLYIVAYALIGAFWTFYWQGALRLSGYEVPAAGEAVGAGYMAAKLAELLRTGDGQALDVMAMNLVRFVTWQSPLLVPLAVLALPAISRGVPLARALAAGTVLTVLAMFVLLPFQGHGWGYRYLHGVIGCACLLAGQGWVELTRTMAVPKRSAAAALVGLGWLAAFAVLLPARGLEVERFVAPYAGALADIAADPAQTVIVDTGAMTYGADLVRNDPYLRGDRVVAMLRGLAPARLEALCASGDVAYFGPLEGTRFGLTIDGAIPLPLPPSCRARPVRPR